MAQRTITRGGEGMECLDAKATGFVAICIRLGIDTKKYREARASDPVFREMCEGLEQDLDDLLAGCAYAVAMVDGKPRDLRELSASRIEKFDKRDKDKGSITNVLMLADDEARAYIEDMRGRLLRADRDETESKRRLIELTAFNDVEDGGDPGA